MADDEAATGTESSVSSKWTGGQGTQQQDPLVAVTFQKNPNRKHKFLEAEPKALGITQIGLCVYQITWFGVALSSDLANTTQSIVHITLNLPVIIAGSLAIAAQNLHLPTLRVCLGMQVLACIISILNAFLSGGDLVDTPEHTHCFDWDLWAYNDTTLQTLEQWKQSEENTICRQFQNGYRHLFAGFILVQAALVAISGTLASYCCKVVNCCSPAPKMPVITVQASPAL